MAQTDVSPSDWTDEQLESILHDPGNWIIHSRAGFSLGHSSSLHEALEKFVAWAQFGATMLAIARLPDNNIIVLEEQVQRLLKILTLHEVPEVRAGR